jgi:hypothetical protein
VSALTADSFTRRRLRRWCNCKAHAPGVDDIAVLFAHAQILFLVWVTFGEHKWVSLA